MWPLNAFVDGFPERLNEGHKTVIRDHDVDSTQHVRQALNSWKPMAWFRSLAKDRRSMQSGWIASCRNIHSTRAKFIARVLFPLAPYLLPGFQDTVYDLFIRHIEKTAAGSDNRSAYKAVCDIIRNLKKAGGIEQARKIKEILLQKYKHKPAFKDELSKV